MYRLTFPVTLKYIFEVCESHEYEYIRLVQINQVLTIHCRKPVVSRVVFVGTGIRRKAQAQHDQIIRVIIRVINSLKPYTKTFLFLEYSTVKTLEPKSFPDTKAHTWRIYTQILTFGNRSQTPIFSDAAFIYLLIVYGSNDFILNQKNNKCYNSNIY